MSVATKKQLYKQNVMMSSHSGNKVTHLTADQAKNQRQYQKNSGHIVVVETPKRGRTLSKGLKFAKF